MRIRWSSDAEDDRDQVREYIARDNPRAAVRVDESIAQSVLRLADFPESGSPGLLQGTREIFAYSHCRIVYEIADDTVWIVAVRHTSRQWPPVEDAD